MKKPEDHWSCIVHLNAEDMLKSADIEEKKFINIESECFGPQGDFHATLDIYGLRITRYMISDLLQKS